MLIVANWKAYVETKEKAKKLYAVSGTLAAKAKHELVLCVPYPYLGLFAGGKKSKVRLGAQDVSTSTGGAATGEVTAGMLSRIGASYVIVGHSERRAAGETDAEIAQKLQRALAEKLTPILCVGERVRDADAAYLAVVRTQLSAALGNLSQKERLAVVIAYEPVWAIGKSAAQAITPVDLTEMILYIRKVLNEFLPGKGAQNVPILYGGSTEPANARALASGTGIDGFLVGHASAEPASWIGIIKALA